MTNEFLAAIKQRRTYYGIGKEIQVTEERIQEIAELAVQHTPSAFNSQSARAAVLFGAHHDTLWHIVMEALRAIVPVGTFAKTEEKVNAFAAGAGTILYFEDMAVVEMLQKTYAPYKDNFPVWSMQSNGMLQLAVWTALEQEGLGASLQHYNPLIDESVKVRWNLPDSWKLMAQMPFGAVMAPPDERTFIPIQERVRVFR